MTNRFNKVLLGVLCLVGIGFNAAAQEVPFSPRLNDGGNTYLNIKGDYTFLSNSVMNSVSNGHDVNTPYNGNGSNNSLHVEYVDIDSDPSTFNSSSSTLSLPACSQIYWAGLYWAGNYDVERDGDHRSRYVSGYTDDPNHYDVTQVKLRVPGSATYIDLQADTAADPVGEEDDIIVDGYNTLPNDPYVCYKNVTNILQGLADPTGDYFVGNVRGTRGATTYGCAGWTLVVIYENPTLPGKYISVFDGYEGITTQSGNSTADITVSGFNTIPVGPVNARIGVSTLEGETSLSGDTFGIVSNSSASFTDISDAANPNNNFFNSTISEDGANVTTRNVSSTNAIGFDSDVFDLNNPSNSIIDNGDTSATLRLGTSGDWFASFLVTFGVEIIEPTIVLEKKVEDIGGNDITGLGVNLGQYLDYVLSFVNTGNDDATNYTIRDILPANVTLDETTITVPAGVTWTYDNATREVVFTIPDNLVEEGDPVSEIRMRVQVAENCFDFIDACTDIIENLAYSTYEGVINANQISDDPSVSDFDDCGFTTPGATNFLLDDLSACNFTRTVQLCGADVLLDAGDNFDAYIWYRDENGNSLIDAGDTVLNDGDPDGDPSTFLVSETGTFMVDKQVADPCKDFTEIIIVELFGTTQTNPITALINDTTNTVDGEIVICPNDGSELPQIFLCGLNDTELVQVNIPDADSIEWEQLDETSCGAATADCANTDNSCTWNIVDTGNDFLASDAGQYRMVINYQNGCFSRFYFNIFKNPLDPQYTSRDIICNSDGNITVTNMPIDYEFRLIDQTTGTVLVPYNANPSFDITTNGAYTVEMRQQGVVDGCVFVLDNIGILDRDFQVDVVPQDTDCNGLGEIAISVLNVEPQYYYEISQGGTVVDTFGPSADNNYTFENLNDGVYDVNVSTDDGCTYTEQVTINDLTDLDLTARVSQHITCREGNIQMDSSGGLTPHTYAIWSYVNESGTTVTSYPTVNDIPASEYQTSVIFDILDPGDYTFVVVDRNNCHAISNTVTIYFEPSVDYTTAATDETCFGAEDGTISFNLISTNGYQVEFFLIDDATGLEIASNTSGLFTNLPQGDYTVRLNQRKGSASCDYFENYTISGPTSGVSGDAVLIQDYTCLQDGIIEAQNVAGGTAPYEYSIDGVNFFSGAGAERFSNLTNGNYAITIRDANNCTFVTNTITFDPLNPPSDLTFSASTPNCPALTSDVTVTVVDGNTPFVVEITAPAPIAATSISGNTADFDGLAPGTYTFRVTDNKGCVYDESFTIDPVSQISVVGNLVSNITCFTDTDGEVDFIVSDFNTDYDYSVTGPANFSGNNQTGGTISLTGLDDGTYTIVVTDNLTNCTATTDVTVNAPAAALTLGAAETQPTCITDGSVTLSSTGGWGGNTFTLTNPDTTPFGTNSTGVFNNLTQTGTYNATVTDANGCVVNTTFTLNAAVPPVLAIVPNDTCYDDAVGLTLTANVTSGGDGNYQYSLNGGAAQASNVFAGLTSGTYTIEVRDGNNCTDTASITIDPELSVTATASNITACATDTDINISAAGGDGNYVYAVVADGATPNAGDFAAANPVSVTGAGDYDVYVRDNNGAAGFCEASFDINIVQDAPLAITPSFTPVSCFGGSDGTITLVASGGEAPYQYSIDNGTNYQVSGNFINLTQGTYNLRIRDANNCEATGTVTVTEPNQLVAEAQQTQNYTCLQLGQISVGSVTPTTGGSGDFQYNINGGPWTASTTGGHVFTGLTDGTYTIQVRDANEIGCFITLPNVIIAPLPVEPTLTTSVAYNCDGTGDITILPNDPSYTYSLNGGAAQAGNVFTSVAVGTHTIDVNYGSDCVTQTTVTVEPGNAFGANITTFSDISCNAGTDGSITFEIENFDAVNGFEYQVNGGGYSAPQTTSPITINGLAAGAYTIEVRDILDNTCLITLNQTLSEPTAVVTTASITSVLTCTNGGSTITASAAGGTPAYEYQLEDNIGTILTAYQSSNVFTGLAAGDYIIRARDTNLCEDPIDTALTVVTPTPITFTSTPTACYSGSNDGTIQVDVTAGNGDYQFSLNGGPWITPTPANATTHTFTALAAGNYTINVRDGFGCTGTLQNITINDALVATVDVVDISTCANGSITVTASGGVPNLEYAFVPTTTSPTGLFTTTNTFAVTAGNDGDYDVYVRDNSATVPFCEFMETVTVNPATPLTITSTPTPPECHDGFGSIQVDITSGIAPYTIQIIDLDNGGAGNLTDTNVLVTSRTYFNLLSGDYTINVTDATGCLVTDTPVNIANPDELTATISGVTPATCTGDPNDFGFQFTGYPTTLGTIQFSDDGGATWTAGDNSVPGTTDVITGYNSGDIVNPSMRTVDGLGNTVCQTDFPPFLIPYPLDDLDITISALVVNCNELQVTVQGSEGAPGYEYAYSDDPGNFNPGTATWFPGDSVDNLGNPVTAGHGRYIWTGLVPGRTYLFYVRDSGGCVRQSNVNVNDLITVPLEITSAITPSCSGANNGSITYTVTDNQAPFGTEFRWTVYDMTSGSPVAVANSGGNVPYTSPQNVTVSGLGAGNYFIEVVEVDGGLDSCVGATENELLDELDPLTGTPVVLQNISCDNPGLIQVQNPFGGGGTYTYTVTGPVPFVTITSTSDNPIEIPANSPAGNYHVTIEDQYGCSTPLGNVALTLTPDPTIDSTNVDNCSDPATVTINATSGAAQIFYSLDGGTTYLDNGGVFSNVAAGTYNISILDSNGCTDTDVVTVHPVLEVDVALTKLLDCSVSPDAEITIEVLAGSGDYDYQITDGTGTVVARTALPSNPFVFSTTTVENYTITVFDNLTSTPCTRVFNIPVAPALTPSFNITSTADVTCNGNDDGTIDVAAVDNGTGPFTFEIISGPGSSATFPLAPTSSNPTTASFTGLEGTAAGITYTIEITAANGCTSTQTQTITQPDVLSNINTTVVEFGCTTGNNMNNATITVDTASITGGSGNYVTYEFIDDQGTVPTGDDVVVQVGPSNVYTETNTAGGSYIINVYDDNGCVGTVTESIAPFDELVSASIAVDAAATCLAGEDITITANGSITNSGTTPANYEFRLLPAGIFQASGSFTGLAVGTHNFEVRNVVTGCVLATSHTVADPEILDLVVVNTTNITCFGDTNGAVELDLQDALALTYASATTYTLYYDINNTPGNLADDVVTAGGDADGNFNITGLAAGNYYIEVTDTNPPGSACVYTESFTIAGPSVGISANTQVTDVTCALNDGIIEVINPAGGWGSYTYFVDLASNPAPTFPGSYQVSPQFSGLAGGAGAGTDYQVWVADVNGCEFQLPNVNLVDPTPITATLQINQENCAALQGEIEVVGTAGGQGSNYTYQLIRNGSNVGSPQTSPIFSGLGEGSYEVLIADQWSCTTTVGPEVLIETMSATATVVKPMDCTVDPGGHITINVTGGSANLTYDVLFPDGLTTANNTTGVFTGLTQAGTYTFTITDGDTVTPCTVVLTQGLDAPVTPVIDDVVMAPVSCNGGSDGSLTVVLDPATVPNPVYTYELYEITNLAVPYRVAQTSNVFDNLPQGDYRARVISGRSCDDFFDQTVTEPTVLNVSASATAFVCNVSNAVNTSTITVTASGGTGPYLYSIDNVNFQTSNTFDVVDTGVVQNITAYVTDANSCAQTAVVAPIQPINVFTVAVTQNIGITCANPEEVLVTITDDGNPANTYTFELLPVGNPAGTLTATPTNVTATFELTQPGSYTFRITDNATGCYVDTAPYDIAPYDTIDVVATPTAPAVCFGDTNGALEINVTGYTGAYDYEVFNSDGTTTGVTGSANTSTNPLPIAGFPGGNYYVRVTQTANPLCVEDSNTITITSPDMALAATPIEVANVTCANNLGEIEVSPTGGFAPYDIQLTNTTTAQVYNVSNVVSFVFQGLSAGLFDVEITDTAGCTINEPITLTQPTPITADIDATPTTLVCYGDTNATVTAINVLNGRGVYLYELNTYDPTGTTIVSTTGAQSNAAFNNLGAGIYSITVSDGWSCGVETAQVTISEPVEVMANLIQLSQLTCTAQAQIELTAAGGTGPYEFSSDGVLYTNMSGGNTHTFTVPVGAYQYYVRDAFGCEAMISNQVTVDPIIPLDVVIDDSAATINCTGEASATIRATAVGGLGNYSYELFTDAGLTNSVAGPQNDGEFSGLIAGTYFVNVISMDCQVTSTAINITDPTPLQIDRQESTDVTCSGLDDGTITVEVSGGTGEIFYAITPNLDQFDTVGTFEDLAPGIYDVIAQDRNGCFETFQFEILQPEPIQAQAINVMHEVCFNSADGSFELDITGGTAPYFSSLNSNADTDFVQDQILFQNLPAGMHVVFVRDAQGCETNIIVEINAGVNLAAEVTPIYECDGNLPTNRLDIVFEDTSVISDVMYAIDSTDPADLQLTSDFMNIASGDHFLTIAHANGCINTIDFSITGFEPLTLVLENNNINEITAVAEGGLEDYTFIFDGVDNGTDNTYIINRTDAYTVTVIDQNGCEVTMEIYMEFIDIEVPDFFTPDGDGMNDNWLPDNLEAFPNVLMIIFDRYGRELYRMRYGDPGWNGIYNNSELPTGDYWYIIKLQGENDDRELVGHFTLYRN